MSLAEFADTSCFFPCRRCCEFLQEGDRFCRYCGEDQVETEGARSPSPEADFEDTLQPGQEGEIGIGPASAANETVDPERDIADPDAAGRQRSRALRAPWHWAGTSIATNRAAMGFLGLLVVLALALGRGLHVDALETARRDDAGAQRPTQAPERLAPMREAEPARPGGSDPLRDDASKVSEALGLGELAARAADAPSPPAAPAAPTVPAVAVADLGVADPKERPCNEALAALGLCPLK